MMFCVQCGKEISDAAKFCPHCGAPMEVEVVGETAEEAPAAEEAADAPTEE